MLLCEVPLQRLIGLRPLLSIDFENVLSLSSVPMLCYFFMRTDMAQ